MSQGVRLMAFWAKQANNGETYHEGKLGGATVRLFLNGYRKTDRDPDVIMYISQTPFDKSKSKAPAQANAPRPQARPQQQQAPSRPQPQLKRIEPKPDYVDHTQGGYGSDPQDLNVPWPTDDESIPF